MKTSYGRGGGKKGFTIHPGLLVCAVAFALVAGLLLIRYLTPVRVEANVTLLEAERVAGPRAAAPLPNLFSERLGTGESYAAANRVGELSDFVLRLGLHRWKSELDGRIPLTVEGLLAGLRDAGRLPPRMALESEGGKLNTPYSTIFVRYRAIPFAVEVVSVPRSERKGTALLLRLPSDPDEPVPVEALARLELRRLIEGVPTDPRARYALYSWQSERPHEATTAQLPPVAFAPPDQLLGYGWNKENMPVLARLSSQQLAELKAWVDRAE